MVEGVMYELTVTFSLVAGTAALLLSLLLWDTLYRTPFGRAVFAIAVLMGLFSLYHVVVLTLPERLFVTTAAKSVTLTGAVVVVGLMIRLDRRLRDRTTGGGGR